MRISHRFLTGSACLLVLLPGCLGPPPHPYTLTPGSEGAPGVDSLLVLPLNLTVEMPSEFERPSKRVYELMRSYLEADGRGVVSLKYSDARQRWLRAVEEVEESERLPHDFETAMMLFAHQLRERREFDALVMPALVYRSARLQGWSASWDGVKRAIEVNAPRKYHSVHLAPPSGSIPSPSLLVMVFDGKGEKVFESYGGLDVVHSIDFGEELSFHYVLRRDRFQDEALLREGIELAFDPYIARPGSAAEDATVASP